MRLITFKLYRAFPELDDYTDSQCEELMARVRRSLGSQVLIVAAAIATFMFVGVITVIAFAVFNASVNHAGVSILRENLIHGVACFFVVGIPAIAALITRDLLLRTMIYRAVKLHLDHVRCPICRYLLLGQRAADGLVRCPECGTASSLRRMGITESDLIPPQDTTAVGRRD